MNRRTSVVSKVHDADIFYLSFSFNHRVTDGLTGAEFGKAVIRSLVEQRKHPARLCRLAELTIFGSHGQRTAGEFKVFVRGNCEIDALVSGRCGTVSASVQASEHHCNLEKLL